MFYVINFHYFDSLCFCSFRRSCRESNKIFYSSFNLIIRYITKVKRDPWRVTFNRSLPHSLHEYSYDPTFEGNFHLVKNREYVRYLRKANFKMLINPISHYDWSDLYLSTNLAVAINIFYNTLSSFFVTCISLFYPPYSSTHLWFTKELTHLQNWNSRFF